MLSLISPEDCSADVLGRHYLPYRQAFQESLQEPVVCGANTSSQRLGASLPGGIKQIENVPLECKQTIVKHSSCGVMMLFRVFPGNLIRHIDVLTNRKGIGRNYSFPSLGKVWASWPVLCISLTHLRTPALSVMSWSSKDTEAQRDDMLHSTT